MTSPATARRCPLSRPRIRSLAAAALGAAVLGAAPQALGAGAAVTIADTGTTASALQADMTARALRAQGFTVTRVTQPGARAADAAMGAGTVDAYVTDTATLLENVLARPEEKRRNRLAAALQAGAHGRGIAGFTVADDSPTVACSRVAMRRHRIGTLLNLPRVARPLSYGATPQHLVRADGFLALRARFHRVIVNPGTGRFDLIRRGRVHCVLSSAAEPRAARLRLVTLRDTTRRLAGTPTLGVVVTSPAYLTGAPPAYGPTVDRVGAAITQDALLTARGQIELDAAAVDAVAGARLAATGIPG